MNKIIDENYDNIEDAEKRKEELSKIADVTNLMLRITNKKITLSGNIKIN